ncbi:MAG: hypothetical protein NTW03_05540 [Verrucomicrobia bacterium]|nr:hypothetical protein [Verrucomicrobiota bacterium]
MTLSRAGVTGVNAAEVQALPAGTFIALNRNSGGTLVGKVC